VRDLLLGLPSYFPVWIFLTKECHDVKCFFAYLVIFSQVHIRESTPTYLRLELDSPDLTEEVNPEAFIGFGRYFRSGYIWIWVALK
jgi:hypothetical protein